MFGNNPIRKVEREVADDGALAVQEIFFTVQGEGPFAGRPAVFVRLAGCHLACTFCDTEFESNINQRQTPAEIALTAYNLWTPLMRRLAGVANDMIPLVVLTGGEPLRQEVGPLIDELVRKGMRTQIETAGNVWRESLLPFLYSQQITVVISPKTPHVHKSLAGWCHDWKYIIKAGEIADDGLPSVGTQGPNSGPPARPLARASKQPTIWVSPCDEYDPAKNAANVQAVGAISLAHGYRVCLQIHKHLRLP